MDAALISPFITSVQNVFSTMLQLPVTVSDPSAAPAPRAGRDIRAIVSMHGDLFGSVALTLPAKTAVAVATLFTGTRLEPGQPDFADAIGELINMICGNAKALFPGRRRVGISCPSVVLDSPDVGDTPSMTPGATIHCLTDCGPFVIEVALCEPAALGGARSNLTEAAAGTP